MATFRKTLSTTVDEEQYKRIEECIAWLKEREAKYGWDVAPKDMSQFVNVAINAYLGIEEHRKKGLSIKFM